MQAIHPPSHLTTRSLQVQLPPERKEAALKYLEEKKRELGTE